VTRQFTTAPYPHGLHSLSIRVLSLSTAPEILAEQLHRERGMTPTELTAAERAMIALMCLPVILVGLLYLVA
jgi:hypothetical protein